MDLVLSPAGFFVLSAGLIGAIVSLNRPIFGLILLVLAAVAVDYATHDLLLMAAVDFVIIILLSMRIAQERQTLYPGEPIRVKTSSDGLFRWLGALSVIYMIVGFVRGNDATFIVGDAFHLLIEIVFPFFLVEIFLRSPERLDRFTRTMSVWMLGFAALVLVLYVTGLFHKLPGAGYWYRDSGILRIRYNHHFPLPPLAWLVGVWLFQSKEEGRMRTALAVMAMLVILILGLKRTLWVSFMLILVFYFTRIGGRQRFQAVRTVFAAVFVVMIAAWIFLPGQLMEQVSDFEGYADIVRNRFSTRDSDITVSWANRQIQVGQALQTALRNPLGYGLGSEFELAFSARTGVLLPTHHVHNGFVQYLLQLGVWWLFVIVALSIRVFAIGIRTFNRLPDSTLKGSVLGAMGAYMAVLLVSLTEIGVNTFFLPFSAAYIFVADVVTRPRDERASAGLADDREPTS